MSEVAERPGDGAGPAGPNGVPGDAGGGRKGRVRKARDSDGPSLVRAPVLDPNRPMPQSDDAERGLLCSMLRSPGETVASCVSQGVTPEHFYHPGHGVLFRAMAEMWDSSRKVDLITLTQWLSDRGLLDQVGGAPYVTSLLTFIATAAFREHYIEILKEKYLLRKVIATCGSLAASAYDEQADVKQFLDRVESEVHAISDERGGGEVREMRHLVLEAMDSIERLYHRKGELGGCATGFKDLDQMTDGLHPGEMFIIAARPGMGKTALAMNMAEHVALSGRVPVAVFSLEMTAQQLVQRLLCSRARVNLRRIRDGFVSQNDVPSLTQAAREFGESPLYIDETGGLSIVQLRARARRLKAQHDIGLVVVDYLQLVTSETRRAKESRQQEITEISAGLKGLAKELNVPVIALSQLNRNPEGRTGESKGRPRISDLRESGAIEQDADVVALLVRPEMYEDDPEAKQERKGEAELYIEKQRNGPTGMVKLTFLEDFTRFEDRAPARAAVGE